jgi:glycine cleavage system protein P-like pyridoxal-binding family
LEDADGRALLVAVTERRTRAEIDTFVSAMQQVLA